MIFYATLLSLMSYYALAYYLFTPIADPHLQVKRHKEFLTSRDVTGRIYLSEEGINGQMSGAMADAEAFMDWLRQDYPTIKFKIHEIKENIFPRMTVKYRKQLVAIDAPYDINLRGQYLSPKQWREKLESNPDALLIDVRNDYEWKIGHFEGSTLPPLSQFRDFPEYADHIPKDAEVLMCCTGGIRCEIYSAVLKAKGIDKVYQLEGGIINYGLKEGQAHWKGKLFVFDDRMAVSIDGQEVQPIAECQYCSAPTDLYYNCANMSCNELFLSCPSCIQEHKGCCCTDCEQSDQVRPYEREGGNKPFRRKHLLSSQKDYSANPSSSITS
jgi:UPF0176 protein